MKKNLGPNFLKLNTFSLVIILAYIFTFCLMTGFPKNSFIFERFYTSVPIILMMLIWSQKKAYLIQLPDAQLNVDTAFQRDLFLFNFCLVISSFFSFILHFDEEGVRIFWSVIFCVFFIYGFIFAAFFSLILKLKKEHKRYSLFSVPFFLSFFPLLEFFFNLPIFKNIGELYSAFIISIMFLLLHGLILSLNKKL